MTMPPEQHLAAVPLPPPLPPPTAQTEVEGTGQDSSDSAPPRARGSFAIGEDLG